jgi:hypothetical protein
MLNGGIVGEKEACCALGRNVVESHFAAAFVLADVHDLAVA